MTERIYYTDPSCRVFDAVVTKSFEHGGRAAVVLDRTAFYPTSGGQPFDTGRLGPAQVLDTIDGDPGVIHVLSEPLPAGTQVRGEIDWNRRFDHMQQHTGQHVLSAAFDRLFGNRTVSFHMGAELSTIDLAREATPAEIERAADEANAVVWSDRPVAIRFVSSDEASRLELRKEPARQGTLRLIEVRDFDLSACGGTHVSSTGAIGIIAVTATERFRGGTRVTFACGARALAVMRSYRVAVAGSIRVLSVLPTELPQAIERVQGELKALRKTLARQQEALAVHEAARLVAAAGTHAPIRVVVERLDDCDVAGLKAIAAALAAHGNVAAVLFSSSPAAVVVARSAGVTLDAAAVLQALTERFGGRGGGKPDLALGGGLTGSPEDMLATARQLLTASA